MNNIDTLKMITGCVVGWGLILHLCFSRSMLTVHGSRSQKKMGLIRAIFTLIHMYYFGYSNTLFVNPNTKVKVREEEREMRKNRPSRSVMIFEVDR